MRIFTLVGILVTLGVLAWLGATVLPQQFNIATSSKQKAQEAAKLIEDSQRRAKEAIGNLSSRMQFSQEDKAKIDAWITQGGRNQFGDPHDTVYAGGTPLFDELTGETLDRYTYILKQYPELKAQLGLNF